MRSTRWASTLAAAATVAALTACGGKGKAPANQGAASADTGSAAVQITAQSRADAQQIFSTRCSVCHGMTGHGDGPGSISLNPKPRNYHDKAWQDSVTDKEIETAIVYGGAAVGRSAAMVPNPDLASKPDVVAALREIVRKFGREQ